MSTVALIVRLHRLNILTDWQYRTFCIDATEFGYRKNEPFGAKRRIVYRLEEGINGAMDRENNKDRYRK